MKHVIAFCAFVALLLVGVGWISWTALRLERAEVQSRRQAALEENVRLALWRMDSALMPLVTGEIAWPSPARASGQPDLPRGVLLRFRLDEGGLTVVQAADSGALGGRLERLRPRLVRDVLARALPPAPAPLAGADEPAPIASQSARNALEWQARSRSVRALADATQQNAAPRGPQPAAPALAALWLDGELVLARHGPARETYDGSWLDWPTLAASLLREVSSLLPGARLVPAERAGDGQRQLASLPVRLIPGSPPEVAGSGVPVLAILGVAWSGVVLAAAAVLALLLGALALGERRAAFVSAVSHELRTPLTTFRAYTEMLAGGKIQDESQRQSYLETLHREALRLGHLVENVLAWARIEKGSRTRLEPVSVAALLERARARLSERSALAGMELCVEPAPDDPRALADPVAVEQVLFNLVDNACKYAATSTDKRIDLTASIERGAILLRVIDRGPGVAAHLRRRLFRPFSRPASEAAGSAPGVGLGLALSRRLARAMGGDLVLEDRPEGASFALRLRRS